MDRRQGFRLTWLLQFLTASLMLGLMGCGGGGNGGESSQTQTPSTPDFSLGLNPATESISGGNSATATLSATAIDGFASAISIQVSGLADGVSVSPSKITLTPGTSQQVTFSAAPNAVTSKQTITLTGTSGLLTHATQLNLSITGTSSGLPTRTRYVRTDATTDYFEWLNQNWILYHASTARYFVTDPSSNRVIVIDGASEKKIASLGVPGAFGIGDTPDHSILYVGTLIGDVYTIDPVGMTVTRRYIASQIGPYGFFAYTALVLADGQVALVGGPSNPNVGQSVSIAVWNPVDNSITNYGENGTHESSAFPCNVFAGTIAGFTLSADRTQIIFGIGGTLCEMNPSTRTGTSATGASLELVDLYHITVTPDGKYVILANNLLTLQPAVADVFDAHTLTEVAQFNVLGDTAGDSSFFVSADSTTLFTPTESIIYAYNLATQQLVGWTPNIFVRPDFVGSSIAFGAINNPYLLATDGTGLFAGPMGEGIGFVDLSALQTGTVGTQFMDGSLSPATGPTSGGTAIQWSDESPVGNLKSVDFGLQPASAISEASGSFNLTAITASSPPGSAGAADVYAFTADGGMQLLPEGFSYGPTILEVTPNMATAEGGGTGYIYGYGFGPLSTTTIPSDLKVTIAGVAAQISAFFPNAYNLAYPPFPLQAIAYTIPPGATGSSVNVAVSTNSGSTTASGALTYLSPIQLFELAGSTLAQGTYDSYTGLYYFTDTNQLQVFSRTRGEWLSPISIPAPKGATQRLWGIALSPDGKNLVVSDAMAGVIYVLNPTSPSSVKTFPIQPIYGAVTNPAGVAISDLGMVYYAVVELGIGGAEQFFKLDTTTGAITNYGIQGPNFPQDIYLRTMISSDNSRVFFNDLGYIFYIDTATDTMIPANIYLECCYLGYGNYDMVLSSNQVHFDATGYFYDFNLNAESFYAMNDREVLNIAYVYGTKLSPDGRLSFQPSTNGVDVFDGELGNLLNRISLPVPLSPNYDALVDDGTDNILIAITGSGNGIAIVDLTSINEPLPLPYKRRPASRQYHPAQRPSSLTNVNPRVQQSQLAQPSRPVRHVTRAVLPYIK